VTATFLVELYLPCQTPASADDIVERARAAAEVLARRGTDVRLVRSILVPGDDSVLCVWEGPSAAAVGEASLLADLPYERVVPAELQGES
jgi:hypothetical protein